MQQNQRYNNGARLLLLMSGTITSLLLFAWLFSSLPPAQAQSTQPSYSWQPLPGLRSGVGDPSVAVLKGKIHVAGGIESYGSSGFHEAFDPVTYQWESLPDVPKQLANAASAVVDGNLYVMGGYNLLAGGALSYTYIYEPDARNWITATAMISPASGAGVAVIHNEIYVFGGFDNYAESRRVQSYEPVSDRWRLRSPMPVGRSEFGMATVDGLLYMIGGNVRVYTDTEGVGMVTARSETIGADAGTDVGTLSTLVSVYDPVTDSWRDVAPLPEPRVAMAVAVHENQIYVIGGVDAWISGTVQSSVYAYNPATDQWSTMPPLLTPRSGTRAAVLDGQIYVIGGYNQSFVPLLTNETLGSSRRQISYLPVIWR